MRKTTRWWRNLPIKPTRLRPPGAFLGARDSAVAIIMAVMMVPLIVAAGGAIDLARLYIAKTRLIYALDAAALAAGRAYDHTDASKGLDAFNNFFAANYPQGADEKPGTVTPLAPNITGAGVEVTATVTVNTHFLRVIGIPTLSAHWTSRIERLTTGLELALVLDNSSSMGDGTKLADLKTAVNAMLDTVYDVATPEDIRVGVVPFTAMVNIGSGNAAYVNADPGNHYPVDDAASPAIVDTSWKGCVMARPSPNDVNDAYSGADNAADGKWDRFFWEAEHYYWLPDAEGGPGYDCANRWWRRTDGLIPALPRQSGRAGDPAFTNVTPPNGAGSFRHQTTGLPLTDVTPPDTTGPNRSCPTPITPLTSTKQDVVDAVGAMEAWNSSGTLIGEGAAWGWRLLSPGEPFTAEAYTDTNFNKVLVIMTDGQNSIAQQDQWCYTVDAFDGPNANPRYDTGYTAYGYVSEGNLGSTNVNTAVTELNTRFAQLCTSIKEASLDRPVTIYTITFGMADDDPVFGPTQTLMRNCATSPGHYFNAEDAAELAQVFQGLGAQLRGLRVAQ